LFEDFALREQRIYKAKKFKQTGYRRNRQYYDETTAKPRNSNKLAIEEINTTMMKRMQSQEIQTNWLIRKKVISERNR
jgi:hypothetical protein